jgi:hypothetical protein
LEPDEEINVYKTICKTHYERQGFEVHVDVPVSSQVRWRPHLYVQNDSKIILDILDNDVIPEIQLQKYVDVMNELRDVKVYVVLVGNLDYLPELFPSCNRYGIGICVVKNSSVKEILQSRSREIEQLASNAQMAIIPGANYGNMLSLRKCFRTFRKHLLWLERNLPKQSIEILYEGVKDEDLNAISQIRLLRGVDDKLTKDYRDNFNNFRSDHKLAEHGIDAEMRVITDHELAGEIHGRYMYSVDEHDVEIRIQLPPLNSLKGAQWDNIFTDVKVIPPFVKYWNTAKNILTEWNAIEKAVTDHLKHKVEEAERSLAH